MKFERPAILIETLDGSIYRFKLLGWNLRIPIYSARGLVMGLWAWAIRERPNGDLGALGAKELSVIADWDGDPDLLLRSLIWSGFMDKDRHLAVPITFTWVEK